MRASARKFHDFSLFMTHNSRSSGDSAETLYESIGHTDKVGRTQASEFLLKVFLGGIEANSKMVPIYPVPISRSRTVQKRTELAAYRNKTCSPHLQRPRYLVTTSN